MFVMLVMPNRTFGRFTAPHSPENLAMGWTENLDGAMLPDQVAINISRRETCPIISGKRGVAHQ